MQYFQESEMESKQGVIWNSLQMFIIKDSSTDVVAAGQIELEDGIIVLKIF